MTCAMQLYPFDLTHPKRTECNICYEEKMCIPCGSSSNCDVYTCQECRVNHHREKHEEELNDPCGFIYKCPYCCKGDIKIETKTTIINYYNDCDDFPQVNHAYHSAVENGDCCVFPSADVGWNKYEDEQETKKLMSMTKEQLIKEVKDYKTLFKANYESRNEMMGRVMELEQELKTVKEALATIHENISV